MNKPSATTFNFQHTRQESVFRTWFRGEHTNFNPDFARMAEADAALKWVTQGWEPSARTVTPETRITAFGSCFAANISNWLARRNYNILTRDEGSNAYVVKCGEGMVNSFVIRQQFEWAFEGRRFEEALWHGYDAESYGYDEEVRRQTLEIFSKTDLFILTFGLSEVWYDKVTGGVFWRSIPQEAYDPSRHKFRVTTVEENKDNIRAIHDLIRKHRPDAKIICTLSPVPLIATFRPVSCISANSVSKAVLRVALDELMRELGDEGHLHYWPSYEIVTDVFHSPFKQDRRHLPRAVLDFIMMLFEQVWCERQPTDAEMLRHWIAALSASGLVSDRLEGAIKEDSLTALRRIMAKRKLARHPEAEAAIRAQLERLEGMLKA
ncbi:GSCFA domain-containing protein [Jannaschia sp. S6380]|uniref:GSCFA domain-containing protein n=1 Tax=Jannaschia sp. S6380 TaxID=2926408 RepID=UPI001FF35713|nr:GSCFA domain-containing protein [Jannaschia sp. S6380]MCK0168611.1 GSCFA domain-containing protein [Jannaschia sp. S6380]